MALKITTQIGTDKGITSEAYVRISNYQLNKYGSATFNLELFQNKEESMESTSSIPAMLVYQSHNQQIGNSIFVELKIDEEVEGPMGETITQKVVDLSSAQGVDIFTFGYTHLKAKLVDLFGAQNVVDC